MAYSLDDIKNVRDVLERGEWVTVHSLARELEMDTSTVRSCLIALYEADIPLYCDEKRNRYILIDKYNVLEVMDIMEEYGQVLYCMSCHGLMVIQEPDDTQGMEKCRYCGADKDYLIEFGETLEFSEEWQIVMQHLPKDKFLISPEEVERTYERLFGKKMNLKDEEASDDGDGCLD